MRQLLSTDIYAELQDEEINLTPLIDVVFVVLILFMLVAPMVETDRVSLAKKGRNGVSQSTTTTSGMKIYVSATNIIKVDGSPVTESALRDILKKQKKAFPNLVPQLFHDQEAPFGTYQGIKSSVEEAGFESLDVILTSS